jgi:hypothetical protein
MLRVGLHPKDALVIGQLMIGDLFFHVTSTVSRQAMHEDHPPDGDAKLIVVK